MARNTFNEKSDKILGLAYDIRNRVRRLLYHANIHQDTSWRGENYQVLHRHLPDAAVMSIIVNLEDATAWLADGRSPV